MQLYKPELRCAAASMKPREPKVSKVNLETVSLDTECYFVDDPDILLCIVVDGEVGQYVGATSCGQ